LVGWLVGFSVCFVVVVVVVVVVLLLLFSVVVVCLCFVVVVLMFLCFCFVLFFVFVFDLCYGYILIHHATQQESSNTETSFPRVGVGWWQPPGS